MSASIPCVPCCSTTQVVNIPGLQGNSGNNGVNGVNAFAMTTSDITTLVGGNSYTINVTSSLWMVIGMKVIVGQGFGTALPAGKTGPGTFIVTAVPSSNSVTMTFQNLTNDQHSGTIGSGSNTGGALIAAGSST
jgi:hypothetical protein